MKDAISEYRGLFIRVDGCWAKYIWSEQENKWLRSDYSCYYNEEIKLLPISFTEQERILMGIAILIWVDSD